MAQYNGAKNLQENGEDTHNALINLATAAAADSDTMMTQSKTIADLTATTLKSTKVPETPTDRLPK